MPDGVTLEQAEEAFDRLRFEPRECQPLLLVRYFRYSVSAGLVQVLPGECSDAVLAPCRRGSGGRRGRGARPLHLVSARPAAEDRAGLACRPRPDRQQPGWLRVRQQA